MDTSAAITTVKNELRLNEWSAQIEAQKKSNRKIIRIYKNQDPAGNLYPDRVLVIHHL